MKPTAEVTVVPFADSLAGGVRDLIVPIQRDEFGISITYDEQPDLHDIEGFYRQGGGEFWVALAGDEVVGSVALLDIGGGRVALRKMFVKAAYRGSEHKTAKKLLVRLVAHAEAAGMAEIYLGTTAKFLAAHRFYEKAGFARIDELDLPERFPRMHVDTRFYKLSLRAVARLR